MKLRGKQLILKSYNVMANKHQIVKGASLALTPTRGPACKWLREYFGSMGKKWGYLQRFCFGYKWLSYA